MKRGDVIKAVLPGAYGKARPSVVVQTERLSAIESVILCPFTSDITDSEPVRVTVAPTPENGLRKPSQIMVDKIAAVQREKCHEVIGRIDSEAIRKLDAALALVVGLLD